MARIQFGWSVPNGARDEALRGSFPADIQRGFDLVTGHFDSACSIQPGLSITCNMRKPTYWRDGQSLPTWLPFIRNLNLATPYSVNHSVTRRYWRRWPQHSST